VDFSFWVSLLERTLRGRVWGWGLAGAPAASEFSELLELSLVRFSQWLRARNTPGKDRWTKYVEELDTDERQKWIGKYVRKAQAPVLVPCYFYPFRILFYCYAIATL